MSLSTRSAALALVAALALGAPALAQPAPVVVFAASSLQTALDAIVAAYEADNPGTDIAVSYAASSALARQIEAGAPADVFISADTDWMDYLATRSLIDAASRTDRLGNALVLVAPVDSTLLADLGPGFDLAALLGSGDRLAVAETDAVPAGRYARAALESLGLWDQVSGRLAEVENVRAALALVSRGEAPLGIVYTTDALADPGVGIAGTFPDDSHPPIVYPMALIANAGPGAADFLAYLDTPEADAVFAQNGFTVLD